VAVRWQDVPEPGAVRLSLGLGARPGEPLASDTAVLEVDLGPGWDADAGGGSLRLIAGVGVDERTLDWLTHVLGANAALWGLDVIPVHCADPGTGDVLAPATAAPGPVPVTAAVAGSELPGCDLAWLAELLADLGYQCAPGAGEVIVIPPPCRPDITDACGVMGHVQEHLGWRRVAASRPPAEWSASVAAPPGPVMLVRHMLAEEGFEEIWCPAVSSASAAAWPVSDAHLTTRNEAGQLLVLRASILDSLMGHLSGRDRLGAQIRLFDVGLVYRRQGSGVHEAWHVGLVWAARGADPAGLAAMLQSRLGLRPRSTASLVASPDIRDVRYFENGDLDGWVGLPGRSPVSGRQRTTVVAEFLIKAGTGL
jgi:hypothetical protein